MIKKIGDNRYYIRADYFPKKKEILYSQTGKKQFKGIISCFQGNYNDAVQEYAKLFEIQKAKFKSWVNNKTKPLTTFGDLISRFRDTQKPGKRLSGLLDRLEYDCAGFHLKNLSISFYGGVENNREVIGYTKLLDSLNRRLFIQGIGIKEIPKKLDNATKNNLMWAAEKVCQYGYENDILEFFPLKKKIRWKTKARNITLNPEIGFKLFNIIIQNYPEYYPFLFYLSCNPSRVGDIRKLTKFNLYLSEMEIKYTSIKTNVRTTHIIPPELFEYFGNIPQGCDWLFYRKTKNGYKPIGDIKKTWKKIKIMADLPNLRIEDFRHIAATWLKSKGLTTPELMAVGGWKSIQSVEVYHNLNHDEAISSAKQKLRPEDIHNKFLKMTPNNLL